jgi:hypothetical protein
MKTKKPDWADKAEAFVVAIRRELLAHYAAEIRKEAETVSSGEWRDGMEEAANMLDPIRARKGDKS